MSPEEIEQGCIEADKAEQLAKQIEPLLKPEDRVAILSKALAEAKAEIDRIRNELYSETAIYGSLRDDYNALQQQNAEQAKKIEGLKNAVLNPQQDNQL